MFTHETQKRVRYGETDKMGYLYYGHYPFYYEIARTEMIRSINLSYRDMEDVHGILMPVMSINIRYVRPAYYDDLLTMKTTVRKLPTKTITFYTDTFNEKGELMNGGSVKLCFVDSKIKESVEAPEYLMQAIRPFFE